MNQFNFPSEAVNDFLPYTLDCCPACRQAIATSIF
jgi:hypothetical protein